MALETLEEQQAQARRYHLTSDEIKVAKLVAQGASDINIAMRLGIPESTVKLRIRTARRKMSARDRTHLVAQLLRKGIIQ